MSDDYTSFYAECASHLEETDYLARRGIPLEVARRHGLGFIRKWRHPLAPNAPETSRLIIPYDQSVYAARDTAIDADPKHKYKRVGPQGYLPLYNADVLVGVQAPVWVVEGEIDALSIEIAGGVAVAIGGSNNTGAFINRSRGLQKVIIAFDSDPAGRKATAKTVKGLGFFKVPCCVVDIAREGADPAGRLLSENVRDANDVLTRLGIDVLREQIRLGEARLNE